MGCQYTSHDAFLSMNIYLTGHEYVTSNSTAEDEHQSSICYPAHECIAKGKVISLGVHNNVMS